MSLIHQGPEAQDTVPISPPIPAHLARSALRMQYPPSYVLVGVYRLCTDKLLFVPVWDKCRHGVRRGVLVGLAWTVLTFGIQKQFIQLFLSPSHSTLFGYPLPFSVHTYAAIILVGKQVTSILRFFLARNIHIACDRVWSQTLFSRGYSDDFWQPYIEEYPNPPSPTLSPSWYETLLSGTLGRILLKRLLMLPFALYPVVGLFLEAAIKSLSTGAVLHRRYFDAKHMTPYQRAVFVEERKWSYRAFGWTAALLEGLPFVGLVFEIGNRVGGAMWAHDLEKRQHWVREVAGE